MEKHKIKALLLLTVSCLFFTSCIFPTSSTTVKGYVRNYGKPLANADVSFGETGLTTKTTTDAKGFFTVTARHRPMQMLYLKVEKKGYAMDEKVEFPGFAAPTDDVIVEMLETVRY